MVYNHSTHSFIYLNDFMRWNIFYELMMCFVEKSLSGSYLVFKYLAYYLNNSLVPLIKFITRVFIGYYTMCSGFTICLSRNLSILPIKVGHWHNLYKSVFLERRFFYGWFVFKWQIHKMILPVRDWSLNSWIQPSRTVPSFNRFLFISINLIYKRFTRIWTETRIDF